MKRFIGAHVSEELKQEFDEALKLLTKHEKRNVTQTEVFINAMKDTIAYAEIMREKYGIDMV